MEPRRLHSWQVTPAEAAAIQARLARRVRRRAPGGPFRSVAGLDVSYDRGSPWLTAGVVVLGLPGLEPIETAAVRARATFPYLPGLLSFREAPAALAAWARLRTRPDCLLCDGHGLAHPRRFGLACHLGLLVNLPAIGVAKRLLVGACRPPGPERGATSPLLDGKETLGVALRTRASVTPVYVSVGHRMSLERAVATVLACAPRFRIPEPLRQAHALVNRLRAAGAEE